MAQRKKVETATGAAPEGAAQVDSGTPIGTSEQPGATAAAETPPKATEAAPAKPAAAAKASAKSKSPAAETRKATLATAKQSWLQRYEGPHLTLELKLHHPITQRFFKRYFDITSRNAHFVSVFARALLGDDQVKEPEAAIETKIKGVITHFENMVAASKAIMEDAKHTQMASASPTTHQVPIVSRNSKQFFDMLARADEALLYLHTLWLWGEVDDQERSRRELDLKTNLRRAATTVRTICLGLRNRYAKQQSGISSAEADTAAEVLGGESDAPPEDDDDAGAAAAAAIKEAA